MTICTIYDGISKTPASQQIVQCSHQQTFTDKSESLFSDKAW